MQKLPKPIRYNSSHSPLQQEVFLGLFHLNGEFFYGQCVHHSCKALLKPIGCTVFLGFQRFCRNTLYGKRFSGNFLKHFYDFVITEGIGTAKRDNRVVGRRIPDARHCKLRNIPERDPAYLVITGAKNPYFSVRIIKSYGGT